MNGNLITHKVPDKNNHGLYTIEFGEKEKDEKEKKKDANGFSKLIQVLQEHVDELLKKVEDEKVEAK